MGYTKLFVSMRVLFVCLFVCLFCCLAMGNKFDKIIQGIYLGNIDGARDRAGLKAAGITHVVSLKDAPEEMHPGHFLYLLVDAMDVPGFNLSAHFQKCVG